MNSSLVKDDDYKHFNNEPHQCFWCGELTYSPFWSCRECYPKKEAAYKKIKEDGVIKTWIEYVNFVNEFIKTGV